MTVPDMHCALAAGGAVLLDDSPSVCFPWWSFTKTVTAACALRLVDQGALALDAPVDDAPYSLRQLLQHTAGVANYGRLTAYHEAVARGDAPWSEAELLARVDSESLLFEPGTGWAYSNVGYLLVRRIVEAAAGSDMEDAVRRLILDPLALKTVALARQPSDLDDTAWGNAAGYHPGWVYHGLLTGTALEASLLLDGLMAGRLLSADSLRQMLGCHRLGGEVEPHRPWKTHGYGLGLMMGDTAGGMTVGHSGAGPGSVCAVYHFPDREVPVTVAAFSRGGDEAVTENAAVQLAVTKADGSR